MLGLGQFLDLKKIILGKQAPQRTCWGKNSLGKNMGV